MGRYFKNDRLEVITMIDFDQTYETLDKMMEMKRYKPPTPHYFPSVGQINSYAHSNKHEHMLAYLLWLDECLTDKEDREIHKEAIATLRNIVSDLCDEVMAEEERKREEEEDGC